MAAAVSCSGQLRIAQRPVNVCNRAIGRVACNPSAQDQLSQQCSRGKVPRRQAARRVSCQASGFSQPKGGDQGSETRLPNSREDAVRQAAAAIAAQLNTAGAGKGKSTKGFSGAGGRKLSVDVPVLETGTAASVQLAQDILAELPKQLRQQFTIVSCGEDGAAAGSSGSGGSGIPVVSLQQCVAEGRDLDGCILIAAPTTSQLEATMRLLAYWRGPGTVLLNADWSAESAPVEQVAFIKSFEAVYCFLPLQVKVLFILQEGAVFKWCTGGSPSAAPWRIFGKEGNKLVPIGRMMQRPTNADLETAFYNAFGVNNPINRGVNFLKGLGSGGGGKKGGQ